MIELEPATYSLSGNSSPIFPGLAPTIHFLSPNLLTATFSIINLLYIGRKIGLTLYIYLFISQPSWPTPSHPPAKKQESIIREFFTSKFIFFLLVFHFFVVFQEVFLLMALPIVCVIGKKIGSLHLQTLSLSSAVMTLKFSMMLYEGFSTFIAYPAKKTSHRVHITSCKQRWRWIYFKAKMVNGKFQFKRKQRGKGEK